MATLRMNMILLVLILGCFSGSPVAAAEREYFLLESARTKNINALAEEMKRENIALLGMTLSENTLPEVKQQFGPAEQISVGHDGMLVCYRSVHHDDNTMVVFGADIHGDQRLNNFQLVAGSQPFRGKEQCAPSPLVSKETATTSGLKLGLNNVNVRKIWSAPMLEENGHLFVEYDLHRAATYEERPACLIVFASSRMRFEEDKLAWLLVTRGTEGYSGPCIRNTYSRSSK